MTDPPLHAWTATRFSRPLSWPCLCFWRGQTSNRRCCYWNCQTWSVWSAFNNVKISERHSRALLLFPVNGRPTCVVFLGAFDFRFFFGRLRFGLFVLTMISNQSADGRSTKCSSAVPVWSCRTFPRPAATWFEGHAECETWVMGDFV